MSTPLHWYRFLKTFQRNKAPPSFKIVKNLSDVSSSRASLQRSMARFSSSGTSKLFHYRSSRGGTDHSGWISNNHCTTKRLYTSRHSCYSPCHYHDPWWKIAYHDEHQGNHQRYLRKRKKESANWRLCFSLLRFDTITQHSNRGQWNRTYVSTDINTFITHPAHESLYQTTGVYAPYSLQTEVWVLLRPTRIRTVKELWVGAYGLSSLLEQTRMSNHL